MTPRLETKIWALVEAKQAAFWALSDRVWGTPELNYREHRSSEAHGAVLEAEGFKVNRGFGGLPTALLGEAGESGPVIAILGEYDALPGLSQQAGILEPVPIAADGNGHGCGHNLLGAGALLAATAVKDYLETARIPGRVRYYGCPAEEGGSGKGFLVRAGAFDGVDIAITWHPAPFTGVANPVSLACSEVNFHFTGRGSHAGSTPHLGRSALDAVELMNVGANYMREHMPSRARIHYAIIDAGGVAPNVVQAKATVRYLVRGSSVQELQTLLRRVEKIAEGAALMTETRVRWQVVTGEANLVGNTPLERLMHAHLDRLGPPQFDDADRAFAARFQKTFTDDDIRTSYAAFGLKPSKDAALCDFVFPPESGDGTLVTSTDVGNVSWIVPTVQLRSATFAIGTPGHSWQLVAQGKAPAAHKGMAHAAKIMASVTVSLLCQPELIREAKDDHRRRLQETPFIDPIPEGARPELPMH
ncbi:amidohydrolase [Bradyrhizobium manausense]|uniref:M20 family metallopeptidase n=1 Tax=Bradyrhizobium manausense TaxID=989370 RepID=UPI001BAA324F|nr:M20 family metallopeptidase [Bradyrhizobium manausense]MBR0684340.1 amidohydrolase [Bradyrhizobium manausense]